MQEILSNVEQYLMNINTNTNDKSYEWEVNFSETMNDICKLKKIINFSTIIIHLPWMIINVRL